MFIFYLRIIFFNFFFYLKYKPTFIIINDINIKHKNNEHQLLCYIDKNNVYQMFKI